MDTHLTAHKPQKKWRLILSGHSDAYSNMALDETILDSYLQCGMPPTLRIYGWKPFAVSIGYSQDPETSLNVEGCTARGIGLVRRMTGGGVLSHFHDISYSIVCSPEDIGCVQSVAESYKTICAFLLAMYKKMGLKAAFAAPAAGPIARVFRRPAPAHHDFCLASKEKYDIVIGRKKIGGNAQKRKNGAILQHGSIPLEDPYEFIRVLLADPLSCRPDQFTSLREATGDIITYYEAESMLIGSFRETFGASLEPSILSSVERVRLNDLVNNKYSTEDWNFERSRHSAKAVLA